MRVGVITYAVPHLKTQQVLALLTLRKELRLSLHVIPFVSRPSRSPLINHRPAQTVGPTPSVLASFYGMPCEEVDDVRKVNTDFDVAVVAGAGLLPDELVAKKPFINAHPGLIPAVRGLDAFKWAIVEQQPVGCTLHVLDKEVDAGRHLKSVVTPVFAGDTIETLARRHYENEIALMGNFAQFLANPENPLPLAEGRAHKRMPAETEKEMPRLFPAYVERLSAGAKA